MVVLGRFAGAELSCGHDMEVFLVVFSSGARQGLINPACGESPVQTFQLIGWKAVVVPVGQLIGIIFIGISSSFSCAEAGDFSCSYCCFCFVEQS